MFDYSRLSKESTIIISKTPFRLSLLGGGSDYIESIQKWGGLVVGTTINHYSYIACRNLPPFFDYKTRLMYSKIETVKSNDDIEHRVIRACVPVDASLEISHVSDLPSSSGTGSSSTFLVGLLNAVNTLRGNKMNCFDLYDVACHIEQKVLGEHVGCQDQAWAAFGGFNAISWEKNGRISVRKLCLPQAHMEYFNRTLLMFYTGIQRRSSEIASSYVPTLQNKEYEHRLLVRLAGEGIRAIQDGDYGRLGDLMRESWFIKKDMSPQVSTPEIERMIGAAEAYGAKGKLMGAGGGGCLIFSVNTNVRGDIIRAVESCGAVHIPFKFEPYGSRIILEDRND